MGKWGYGANEAYEANEAHGANRANGAYEAYGSMLHECFSPVLLSVENHGHLNLCSSPSAFLTNGSFGGLTISLEETKEHRRGCNPRRDCDNKRSPEGATET